MIETADKLAVALGYLESLSSDVEAEREQGFFVALLAINYGLKVMEHFGLIDGDTPPIPANLVQARQAIGNLLAAVRDDIRHGQAALGFASDAEDLPVLPDGSEAQADAEPPSPDAGEVHRG